MQQDLLTLTHEKWFKGGYNGFGLTCEEFDK